MEAWVWGDPNPLAHSVRRPALSKLDFPTPPLILYKAPSHPLGGEPQVSLSLDSCVELDFSLSNLHLRRKVALSPSTWRSGRRDTDMLEEDTGRGIICLILVEREGENILVTSVYTSSYGCLPLASSTSTSATVVGEI